MCVIMLQPKGKTIDEDTLVAGWRANPDGAGMAYVKDGKVVIDKGYMKLGDFLDARRKLDLSDTTALFHFRIRTHGLSDAERTHPFAVGNAALAHNGTLSCVEDDAVMSDTQIFIARYPKLFTSKELLRKEAAVLGNYITWSKFAVLFPDGDYVIINESHGKWVDGCWYSNTYWRATASVLPAKRTNN